ncbi:DUF3267 domain-containing protein [Virgibacillus soli]|uniref:DUF3267 domain-containing protein n=1 Tax=Paracerasibacillus soli TaxID=480284 RepID=A0ABU5CN80_9BACI|nr:DUF3267 domain-containing protein [Virgibacillus soli]MDY0407814.1 DUF3267 domain-containing protein [Virgibacillus soli]
MYCWKSINLSKDFGLFRMYTISCFISILAFILMYVPTSIFHGLHHVNEYALLGLLLALYLLPTIHTAAHILSLIFFKKRVKVTYSSKSKVIPAFSYMPYQCLPKGISIVVALAPTLFITVPAIVAIYLYSSAYIHILLFTSIHLGYSFYDFLYISHIVKAPKCAFVDHNNSALNFDILLKKN